MPSDTGEQHDQYVTAFSAKSSEIDVFDADSIWPAEFAQANYELELDRFIEADNIDMDAYFPGQVESGNFIVKQWEMPKFLDYVVIFSRSYIVDNSTVPFDDIIYKS